MSLPGQTHDDAIEEQIQRLMDRGFDEEAARAAVETLHQGATPRPDHEDDRDPEHEHDNEHDRGRPEAHAIDEEEEEAQIQQQTARKGRAASTEQTAKPAFKMKPMHWALVAVVGAGLGFVIKTVSANKAPTAMVQSAPGQGFFDNTQQGQPPVGPQAQMNVSQPPQPAIGPQGDRYAQDGMPQSAGNQASRYAPRPASMPMQQTQAQPQAYPGQQVSLQGAGYQDTASQPIAYNPPADQTSISQGGAADTNMPTPDEYAASQAQTAQRVRPASQPVAQADQRVGDAGTPDANPGSARLSAADIAAITKQLDGLEAQISSLRRILQASNGVPANSVTVRKVARHAIPRQPTRVAKQQPAPEKMMVLAADSGSIVLHTAAGDQTYHVGDTLPSGAKYGGYSDGKVHTSRGDVTVE